MPATYDGGASDAGKVRLLIPDTDTSNALFSDDEISAFLSLGESSVFRGAALAIEVIASNQAMTARVVAGPLQLDATRAAADLLARAKQLRQAALDAEAGEEGAFDVAEEVLDQFSARERIWKQALRNRLL